MPRARSVRIAEIQAHPHQSLLAGDYLEDEDCVCRLCGQVINNCDPHAHVCPGRAQDAAEEFCADD